MVVCIALFLAYTTMPSYAQQKGVVLLVVNYAMANLTFDLMAHNMSGRSFSYFSLAMPLLALPVLAYHLGEVSAPVELQLTQAAAAALFSIFMGKMTVLSW